MSTDLAAAWADLDTVLVELRGTDPEAPVAVDVDPSKLIVPGVWVRVDHVRRARLSGHLSFALTLHLIAADTDEAIVRDQLAELWNHVTPILDSYGGPTGPGDLVAVAMPSGAAPLPAISIPVDIETE